MENGSVLSTFQRIWIWPIKSYSCVKRYSFLVNWQISTKWNLFPQNFNISYQDFEFKFDYSWQHCHVAATKMCIVVCGCLATCNNCLCGRALNWKWKKMTLNRTFKTMKLLSNWEVLLDNVCIDWLTNRKVTTN